MPNPRRSTAAAAVAFLLAASAAGVGTPLAGAQPDPASLSGPVPAETIDRDGSRRLRPALHDAAFPEIALATLAAEPRPPPAGAVPAAPERADLTDQVTALHARHDRSIPTSLRLDLERLEAAHPRTSDALAEIVAAHLHQAEATERALQGVDPDGSPAPGDLDRGLLLDVRDRTARRVLDNAPRLEPVGSDPVPATVGECPTFHIDLAGEDSVYGSDCGLIIDLGGDDLYTNNAGAGTFGAAMVVDVTGDDRYQDGRLAGGVTDAYNGAGTFGSGFLLDLAGSDRYLALAQAFFGGISASANGGAFFGSGVLLDGDGSDGYGVLTESLSSSPQAQVQVGIHGGGVAGSGVLVDGDGDDTYASLAASHNSTVLAGIGGGAHIGGTGTLVDRDGNDTHNVTLSAAGAAFAGVNGGVSDSGDAGLVDLDGDDVYRVNATVEDLDRSEGFSVSLGLNGGASDGTASLRDLQGDDTYHVLAPTGDPMLLQGVAANGGAASGSGLLADGGGSDTYHGPSVVCEDCTRVPKGAVGAQVDRPEPP